MASPPSGHILKQLLGTAAPTPVINTDPYQTNHATQHTDVDDGNRYGHVTGEGNAKPLPPLPPSFVEDCEDLVKLYGDGMPGRGKYPISSTLSPISLTLLPPLHTPSFLFPHLPHLFQDIAWAIVLEAIARRTPPCSPPARPQVTHPLSTLPLLNSLILFPLSELHNKSCF